MLYDRKIKYLDYYEGGNKVNGGGFIKLEVRENTLRIELAVRGLHPTDSFERDIVLQGAEKEETLGQIRIQNGFGQFRYSCGADQGIGGTEISYSDLRGIRIPIGGTREILCRWDNVPGKRRIIPPEENTQKTKPVLQESGRVPIVESYTDNKADSGALVYAENELKHESKPEKTEKADEIRKEAQKKGYESIEDKGRKEENKEDIDKGTQEDENREGIEGEIQGDEIREGIEVEIQGDEIREGIEGDEIREGENREEQESKNRESKDRDRQEDKTREDKNREEQEDKNRESKDRDRQEDKNREGKNRESQEDENREDIENKECREDTKKDIERNESQERDNEGLETGFQSGGQSEGWVKDKSDVVMNSHEEQPDATKAPVKLMEDKWQQLSAIYPHIQPFRDERDYLSLTPSDFVLFPDRFYRAVNNSFLLHGYYNYHHLILARIERRGETIYYIGVPGNYFEREKQVAIMFGFESFECETEPAKTGDFGYYMMRTEL